MTGGIDREALRRSGQILTETLAHLLTLIAPGVSTAELDAEAELLIRDAGGVPAFLGYNGFPATLCASVNHQIVHGLPSAAPLAEGDILSLDLGVKIDGWYTDSAVTVGVGEISPAAQELLDRTAASLRLALPLVRAGYTTGDYGSAVQQSVERHGLAVIRNCFGHGIGRRLHEEPNIPNYGKPGQGTTFTTGMVVAVEPMVVAGSYETVVAADNWAVVTRDRSLAAHFEETVIVTEGVPERLTPLDKVLPGVTTSDRVGRVT